MYGIYLRLLSAAGTGLIPGHDNHPTWNFHRKVFFDWREHDPSRWDDGKCCAGLSPGEQDLCSGMDNREGSALWLILPAGISDHLVIFLFFPKMHPSGAGPGQLWQLP